MSLSEKLFLVAQWLICSNSGAKGSGLNLPQRLGIDEKGPTKTTTYLRSVCSCLKNRKIVFLEPFPASFYLFSSFQYSSSLIKLVVILRICQWLDSNRGSLVSEATALQLRHNHWPLNWLYFKNKLLEGELLEYKYFVLRITVLSLSLQYHHPNGLSSKALLRIVLKPSM